MEPSAAPVQLLPCSSDGTQEVTQVTSNAGHLTGGVIMAGKQSTESIEIWLTLSDHIEQLSDFTTLST